jgi:hypothetical protein
MDMMEVRRRVMLSMGVKLPKDMVVKKIEITVRASSQTIPHNMGVVPDVFFLIPVNAPDGTGQQNPYAYCAYPLTGTSSASDKNTVVNEHSINGTWDYTRNSLGWTADEHNIYLTGSTSNSWVIGEYILVAYKYQ